MPPFDLLSFTELPAEENQTSISQTGKVYQSAAVILQLNTILCKLSSYAPYVVKSLNVN